MWKPGGHFRKHTKEERDNGHTESNRIFLQQIREDIE